MASTTPDNPCYQSLRKLQAYIEQEQFKGYDPYDTLRSKIPFRVFGNMVSVLAIQFQKRNPVNIRPLLGINKAYNPKALGLLLYGYCLMQKQEPEGIYSKQITFLFDRLKNHYSKGFSGYCWGYNFDWASSGKYIKAGSPNIVVTAFVAKGLFAYYDLTKDPQALEMLEGVAQFITKDLPRTEAPEGLCFSYTTLGVDCCYNASLLAGSVLAQLSAINKNETYKALALSAADYVVHKQHADGHWNYSLEPSTGIERKQIDFHQGYVIDCIAEIMRYTGEEKPAYKDAIAKGTTYYRKYQFFANGRSLWRIPKEYPVEIHNQSQGILTFVRMAELDREYAAFAKTIAEWTITHMQDRKGFFYYRKMKHYAHKTPYMRWSQAWMFVALVELLYSTPRHA